MKIAFYSNYLSIHQLPFALAMDELTDHNFIFVAFDPIKEFRLKLGYRDLDHEYPFVLRAYDGEEEKKKALQIAKDCDVMIVGMAADEYRIAHLQTGKLMFCFSESLFKKKPCVKEYINILKLGRYYGGMCRKYPHYMLCASAYTPFDYAMHLGSYLGKTYKWGYFPEIRTYDSIDRLIELKHSASILWVARFIELKHPETALKTAEYLKKRGIEFTMNLIGSGEMSSWTVDYIKEHGLEKCVHLLGAMSPEEVRNHMERSEIFLITSDRNEGWGAVVNEAMNSGCVVVANSLIGSVPYLIEDGKNGALYRYGHQDQLNRIVEELIQNREKRKMLGRNAYETITKRWNARTAAERLISLSNCLMNHKETPFDDGPCSKAKVMIRRK